MPRAAARGSPMAAAEAPALDAAGPSRGAEGDEGGGCSKGGEGWRGGGGDEDVEAEVFGVGRRRVFKAGAGKYKEANGFL